MAKEQPFSPLRRQYREAISSQPSLALTQGSPPLRQCRRRNIAAAVHEDSSTCPLPLPQLLSTIEGREELLELHNQAPDSLGELPEEDAATREARYKSFFDRLDLGEPPGRWQLMSRWLGHVASCRQNRTHFQGQPGCRNGAYSAVARGPAAYFTDHDRNWG